MRITTNNSAGRPPAARSACRARIIRALLSTTILTVPALAAAITATSLPAQADGGRGGEAPGGVVAGGDGGSGFNGTDGAAGGSGVFVGIPVGGGGGGGGAGGGQGGQGGNSGGAGGAGGTAASPNGQTGTPDLFNGGGGGGGGFNGNGAGALTITNGAPLNGGQGGRGGDGMSAGGGGGAGGYGAIVTGVGASSNTSSISGGGGGLGADGVPGGGGSGGDGGVGVLLTAAGRLSNSGTVTGGSGSFGGDSDNFNGGNGGVGGVGAQFTAAGAAFTNSGTVTGGNGGDSGGGNSDPAVVGGAGGAGVLFTAAGAAFTNSGTVTGGNGGTGGGGGDFSPGQSAGVGGSGGVGVQFTAMGATFTNSNAVAGGVGGTGGNGGGGDNGGVGGVGGLGVQLIAAGAAFTNSSTITGGLGGTGGAGGILGGGGGAGGVGGVAVQFTGAAFSNSSTVTGGAGGNGGAAPGDGAISGPFSGFGGAGGSGGVGMQLTGATFTNSGTVIGGSGGGGGSGVVAPGSTGAGGAGIVGSALTIINSGRITGGLSGDGMTRANAITFTGGTNRLELQFGSTITGNVVAFSVADTLALGGTANNSFDVSQIGAAAQYQGFGVYEKVGTSTWTLTGTNAAVLPWTVQQGTLIVSGAITGPTTVNGGALIVNGLITNSATTVNGGALIVNGSTVNSATTVNGGALIVNGLIANSATTVNGGSVGGSGTIGSLAVNGGTVAPGNSIGTLNVNGNFSQAGGVYQVEANAAGQADRINMMGTATISSSTVQVLAQPGAYAANTTYTILSAGGGVAGAYSSVTSNFAFLTPSLAYTANDVLLTLSLAQNAFSSFGGNTPNQRAVGYALDQSFANAAGDFATVLGVLAGLSTTQGPAALTAISGEPWADFGTMNVNNSALFMNALGQQMANARGAANAGQRQALAQACEIEACDGASPLSAWASALGGLGSVLGDSNASTLTYNLGGAAAGIDYRLDPRFLVGIGIGYTHGTQWVNSFMGQGWSDSVSVAAYGSFTQGGFYADALAGYAYSNNQLQRQIVIPGLQQRTASGSTGANQFLGQAEAGYKVGVYAPASASITPFGRLQISSVTQNAFSESGAQSLSLNVAQQTTNSLRTTIGADLASSIGLGNEKRLDLALRLGWQHEFADSGRPITAAFAGAPANSFTVFGATPTRDSAVIGFQAATNIAEATKIYLRYDGGVGGGTDNHALNLGVRFSW